MRAASNSPSASTRTLPFATVHRQFLHMATSCPESIALMQDGYSLTYAELLRRSLSFAAICARAGVTRGTLVAVEANRSFDSIAALLGILFAGGAYVPVDTCDEASAAQLARHDIRFFAGRGFGDKTSADIILLDLENISARRLVQILDLPGEECGWSDPAYVLFTSGSTGARKGVIVPHRGILRLVNGQHFVPMDESARTFLHSPMTFDASTFELWSALLQGGTVVLAPARPLSVEDFRALVPEYGITTLWLTAGLFHLVARHAMETFSTLRHLLVGGDVIDAGLFSSVKHRFPRLRLVNGYGPTENTTFTACYVATDGFCESKVPIGEPLIGSRIYILDETGVPVSEGAPGELATGGEGVALGYLNEPALTATRFVPDLTQPFENARMYLTGDIVRRRGDGQLDFLGRKDSEVKLAGQRVQLDEVEHAILNTDLVSACAVLVVVDDPQDKLLVAFVVWKNGEAEAILREKLKGALPQVAVPRVLRAIDRLPLTENGKVDRAFLRKKFRESSATSVRAIEPDASPSPGDHREWLHKVESIWSRILHRQTIDTKINFFDLGGDSLGLVLMQAELQKISSNAPSIVELFSLPHVESIAEFMSVKAAMSQTKTHQAGRSEMATNMLLEHAGEPV